MKVEVQVEEARSGERAEPIVVECDRITEEDKGIAFRIGAAAGPHVTTPPVLFVKWSELRWYYVRDAEIRIVFDGPPDHDGPRFIEVENEKGESLSIGKWRQLDGDPDRWALVLPRVSDGD